MFPLFPENHEWAFIAAGCVAFLPRDKGHAALVAVPANPKTPVMHCTPGTSDTEGTLAHRSIGSAMITKQDILKRLQVVNGDDGLLFSEATRGSSLAGATWDGIGDDLGPHIHPDVLASCKHVHLTASDFDNTQRIMKKVQKEMRSRGKKKGQWDKSPTDPTLFRDAGCSVQHFLRKGFRRVDGNTVVTAPRDDGSYKIVFLFVVDLPELQSCVVHATDFLHFLDKNKHSFGTTLNITRGSKPMAGCMNVTGAHYGQRGRRKKSVFHYSPSKKKNVEHDLLAGAHYAKAAEMERIVVPAAAASRLRMAKRVDPHGKYVLVAGDAHEKYNGAFAGSSTRGYAVEPHDDSGAAGVLEFVIFVSDE
jgi:hypothetical protein